MHHSCDQNSRDSFIRLVPGTPPFDIRTTNIIILCFSPILSVVALVSHRTLRRGCVIGLGTDGTRHFMNGRPEQQQWKRCETCKGNAKIPRRLPRKGKRKLSADRRVVHDPCKDCNGTGLLPGVCQGTTNLRIAIIGGGIGGLALAAACCHRGMRNVTVFERDDTFCARRQGYGLTMQCVMAFLRSSISYIVDSKDKLRHN